jgi:hypothetical protein
MTILTKRLMVLGPLLIGVNVLLIWTLEHTDIVAFAIVLVFTSLIVFALSQLLWLTLNSAQHIDGQDRQPAAAKQSGRKIDRAMAERSISVFSRDSALGANGVVDDNLPGFGGPSLS